MGFPNSIYLVFPIKGKWSHMSFYSLERKDWPDLNFCATKMVFASPGAHRVSFSGGTQTNKAKLR